LGLDGSAAEAGSLLAFSAEDAGAVLAASEEADAFGVGASLLDAKGDSDEDDDSAAFGLAGVGVRTGAEELAAEAGSADELEITPLEVAELADEAADAGALDDADEAGSAEAADDTAEDVGSLEAADDVALDEVGSLGALDDADDDVSSLDELDAEEAWSPLPSCCAAWSSLTASLTVSSCFGLAICGANTATVLPLASAAAWLGSFTGFGSTTTTLVLVCCSMKFTSITLLTTMLF